jgi:CheY-like chemotaxis protein
LGGSLDVESEEGAGSKFILTVAVQCAEGTRILSPDEAMTYANRTQIDEFKNFDLHGTRVLIVDDGETNRDLITLLLQDSGVEVSIATNGKEAVDLLIDGNHSVDVILMDMQMPIMDGYTATRELRANGLSTPIIALTGNAMVGDDANCREAGCTDYLSKPIDLDALLGLVCRWSDKCSSVDTPGESPSDTPGEPSTASDASRPTPPPTDETGGGAPAQTTSVPEVAASSAAEAGSSLLPDNFLRSFACRFVDKVTDALPGMIAACESGEFDEVSSRAHWIKGTSGTVKLNQLSTLAQECESAAKQSQEEQILSILNEIQDHLSLVQKEREEVGC